ncbi:preprotein translocase, SecE subunit [Acinetobacter baumannii 1457504]|nr:preprotein translocase, SecE subunit [Acinetobacter baumannii 1457504]
MGDSNCIIALGYHGESAFTSVLGPANDVWVRVGVIFACIVVALGLLYATHQGKGFVRLLKDARVELRRVTWPTKQETVTTSWQVLLVVVVASLVLWCFDYGLGWLIKLIIG